MAAGRLTPNRVATVVVLASAGYLGVLLAHSSLYIDDFLREAEAARAGLGWGYLSRPVFGHFVMAWRLVFWLIQRSEPLRWWPLAVLILVAFVAVLTAFYRLLVACVGRRWINVVALAGLAFSPGLVPTELWWSNALHVLFSLAFTLWAMERFTAYLRDRRRTQLAAVVILELCGLGFYEKPVLLLLILPLLTGALATSGPSPTAALRSVWSLRIALIVTWVPLLAFAALYLAAGYGGGLARPSPAFVVHATLLAWLRGIGPPLVGGPLRWRATGPLPVAVGSPSLVLQAAAQVVLGSTLVISLVRHRWAWRGWVFAGVGFVASFAFVGIGRLSSYGLAAASDYRYTADVIPLVLVGVVLALARTEPRLASALGAHPHPRPVPRPPCRRTVAATLAGVAVFGCGVAISAHRYLPGWEAGLPRHYVASLRQGVTALEQRGQPFSLFDTSVSDGVSIDALYPYDLVSATVGTFAAGLRYNDLAVPDYLVDPVTGQVRPARLAVGPAAAPPPGQACLDATHRRLAVSFGTLLPWGLHLLEVVPQTTETAALAITVEPANLLRRPGVPRIFPVQAPGLGTQVVTLRDGHPSLISLIAQPVSGVTVTLRSGSACLASLSIASPVVATGPG